MIYLPDIVDKYYNEDTTFTLKTVPITSHTIPAITFCRVEFYKTDVLLNAIVEKNKRVGRNVFTNNFRNLTLKPNVTVPKLYEQATFLLNRDFTLKATFGGKVLKNGHNRVNGMNITVEEIPTLMNGMCYSMTFELSQDELKNDVFIWLPIVPKVFNDTSSTTFYLTSKNTRHGIVDGFSSNILKPFRFTKPFAYEYSMGVQIEEMQYHFLKGDPNCQEGCTIDQCFTHTDFKDIQCVPVVMKRWFEGSNLTFCLSLQDNAISYVKIMKQKAGMICSIPEYDIKFDATITDSKTWSMAIPQNAIHFALGQRSRFRDIKKEVLIYDAASLVGSLGGFLGLFIGFSFFGTITFLMSKVCKE